MHLEFTCFYFVLIHLEFKRYLHSYTPIVPTKTIPDSRPTGQSVYPFSGKKAQNLSLWGGTYLYGLFKRVSTRGCYSYERLEGSSKSRLLLCFPEEKHLKMMSLWLRSIQSGLDVYRTLERE